MKKIVIYSTFILLFGIFATSCNFFNDDEYQAYLDQVAEYQQKVRDQYVIDSTLIVEYLVENDSTALYHNESGIYYNIIEDGDSFHPNSNSSIEVWYKGMLLDGTVFVQTADSVSSNTFYLASLISGWQIGLPLIGNGGKIVLYLPSYYAFGAEEKTDIPANSVLIFKIDLINFYSY